MLKRAQLRRLQPEAVAACVPEGRVAVRWVVVSNRVAGAERDASAPRRWLWPEQATCCVQLARVLKCRHV